MKANFFNYLIYLLFITLIITGRTPGMVSAADEKLGSSGSSDTGGLVTGNSNVGGSSTDNSGTGNSDTSNSDTGYSDTDNSGAGNSGIGDSQTDGSGTYTSGTGNSDTDDSSPGGSDTGDSGTGGSHTGDSGTGNSDTGSSDTGDSDTGNSGTGDSHTGNSDNSHTGDSDTGNSNTGSSDTGNSGTGDSHSGDSDTGNSDTGDWHIGDPYTGNSHIGNSDSGVSDVGNSDTGESGTGDSGKGNVNEGNSGVGDSHSRNSNTDNSNTETSYIGKSNVSKSDVSNPNIGNSNAGISDRGDSSAENSNIGESGKGISSNSSSSSSGMDLVSSEPATNIDAKELVTRSVMGGIPVRFEFRENVTCITYIEFEPTMTFRKTTTTAEVLKDKSIFVPEPPAGRIYKYVDIWVGDKGAGMPTSLRNGFVGFKVEKAWIKDNSANESMITLQWYDQGWQPLNTERVGEDNNYVYYKAEVSGFSCFAITEYSGPKESIKAISIAEKLQRALIDLSGNRNEMTIGSEKKGSSKIIKDPMRMARMLMAISLPMFLGIVGYCLFKKKI